jgi:dTDP-4-dehydrorhamnose reductase
MKLLITGSTGMVGSELLRQAIIDNDVTSIIALSRKPLDIQHPKLKTIIHKNFLDYSSLGYLFIDCDVCA